MKRFQIYCMHSLRTYRSMPSLQRGGFCMFLFGTFRYLSYFCIRMKMISRYKGVGVSVLFGIAIFLFWYISYPHALSYQEQYQLFLWTSGYLLKRSSIPGGFADWLGEFFVQFYYIEWLGALLLALIYVLLQRVTLFAMWRVSSNLKSVQPSSYVFSFIPSILLLWLMGDPSVLLGYPIAMILNLFFYGCNPTKGWKGICCDIVVVPILYWATGALAWLYIVLRLVQYGWKRMWIIPLLMLSMQLLVYKYILTQWQLKTIFQPMIYYRIPLMIPTLMLVIPVTIAILVLVGRLAILKRYDKIACFLGIATFFVFGWLGMTKGYDKEMYELIRQDYLVRNERWDDVINRAQTYQVRTAFSSVCVNLALAERRQLADRMFDFYQSGEDALIMPRVRDLTSMLPTAEVFWHLGLVNSAQRYMFDTQESILNGKKSGRCTKRIAECMLVNGHYKPAAKQIDLLKKSLFYKDFGKELETMLYNDRKINSHPLYGKLRKYRYKENYLFSYAEIEKMMGLLFLNNPENRIALDYFMGQMLLKGDLQGFQQYMGWVQKYGGYQNMPVGYQDVYMCIQRQGNVPNSPYAAYAKRMMAERGMQ